MTRTYLPIGDYAIIGNGQTAALVGRDGSIDWCCWPRFDSPAVFCRLLDAPRGGFFQISPTGAHRVSREYVGGTNVLQTTFDADDGRVRISDLMPAPSEDSGERIFPHRILRKVECLEGRCNVESRFRPTFDYARSRATFQQHAQGLLAYGRDEALGLISEVSGLIRDDLAVGKADLEAGDELWFLLTHGPAAEADQLMQITPKDAENELRRTIDFWQSWSSRCRYQGPYRDLVLRSALVLKLLAFQPTGGLVASPTTSLPGDIGGMRNWDYRFTWLRDSGLLLDALQQLGYHEESMQFIDWLENLCLSRDGGLQTMYTVEGQPTPCEQSLEHLSGYRESRPVRIGNGAVKQTQTDNFGHVLDAVVLCFERMPREMRPRLWDFLRVLVNDAARQWEQPDHGPWEMRGPPRHFLYSKLYCWVGVDRAVRFARKHGLPGDIEHWQREAARIRDEILRRGFQPDVGAFTQAFDRTEADASALAIPLVNLLPSDDPRVTSTLRYVQQNLATDGLVYRYRNDDGLPGHDSAFVLCSFWLVMNLALSGDHRAAVSAFEHICSFANDVGLLAEQIEPNSGELLGNFPLGISHLGLIRAALHLQDTEEEGRQQKRTADQ